MASREGTVPVDARAWTRQNRIRVVIFLNYRRADSKWATGRLYDALRFANGFLEKELFMDVDNIPPGLDFTDVLRRQVARCEVFVSVIGPRWLEVRGDDGRRRLDDPHDWVRIEVEAALAQDKRVIPVFVDDAPIPKPDDLPESLRPLVLRNAVRLRDDTFGSDVARFAKKLRAALEEIRNAREKAAAAPPLPPAEDWYLVIDGDRVGPLPLDDVRVRWLANEVGPATLAWQAGLDGWKAVQSIPRLSAALPPPLPPPVPTAAPAPHEPPAAGEAPSGKTPARPRAEPVSPPAPSRGPTPVSVPLRLHDGGTLDLPMMALPGGTFRMGGERRDEEKPMHEVRVAPFDLMVVPVTRALYGGLTAADKPADEPSLVKLLGRLVGAGQPPIKGAPNAPVNQVSWIQALALCNALSEAAALPPAYRIDLMPGTNPAAVLKGEHKAVRSVEWMPQTGGFRLPTEAEFEYALRGGTTTEYFWGNAPGQAATYAWFGDPSQGPQPVGGKAPNPFGLCDMAGNVWEWCWDAYGAYPEGQRDDTPTLEGRHVDNPSADGAALRVVRGGSFLDPAGRLRSAYRSRSWPWYRGDRLGFRCARSRPPSML